MIGHQPPTDRPHTRRNNHNLIQVPTVTRDSTVFVDKAKFCLINARSLRNKSLFVRDYVDECSLDIVALTETWLTDEDTTSVSELCRDNFTLIHQPRGGARRGGGIGVLFRKTLQLVSRVSVDTRASETVSVTLRNARTSCTTRVIVMYRPPNSCFGTFLDDVSTVLLIAGTHPTETVVCGDFNTKYGEPTCTDAVNLADLLDTAGFTQHVTGATHERGNTLDLVITAKNLASHCYCCQAHVASHRPLRSRMRTPPVQTKPFEATHHVSKTISYQQQHLRGRLKVVQSER